MTGTLPGARGGSPDRRWYLRPRVALPVVALFIAVVAVLTPEPIEGRSGDTRLTSHSTSPNGASVLYELYRRLGWRVERREQGSLPGDRRAIHVVLDPAAPPTAGETHALLEEVRRGGALLYVMSAMGPLNDSLRVRRGGGNIAVLHPDAPQTPARATADSAGEDESSAHDAHGCDRGSNGAAPMWPDGQIRLWEIRWRRTPPADRVVFAETRRAWAADDHAAPHSPAAVGFAYGRGRIVVVADPDLLRNDVLRVCAWDADVTAVRMLEYLSAGAPGGAGAARRDRVVFDEYHQGYGDHASVGRAVNLFLRRTPAGHAVAQLVVAGLVLVLALGPRGIPPRDVERVQRRSPLEHVGALARAYVHTGASRTAVALLLRGVRRRVERRVPGTQEAGGQRPDGGVTSGREADVFLDWAARRAPERAEDIGVILRALVTPVSRREFEAVGAAMRRLESALLAPRA